MQSAGELDGYKKHESDRFFEVFERTFVRGTASPDELERFSATEVYPAEKCCLWSMYQFGRKHDEVIPALSDDEWRKRALAMSLLLYGWWREERGHVSEWLPVAVLVQAALSVPSLARPIAEFLEWGWVKHGGHASHEPANEVIGPARAFVASAEEPGVVPQLVDDVRRLAVWRHECELFARPPERGWWRQSPCADGLSAWDLGPWAGQWAPVRLSWDLTFDEAKPWIAVFAKLRASINASDPIFELEHWMLAK